MATKEINKHLTANSHIKKRHIIVGNFLGGMAWGVGTVIGASVVVGILIWILSLFNFIPFIGNISESISESINK